ncbi:MAG: exo-alpha-sialidase, partial [Bacteroidota bacterium]
LRIAWDYSSMQKLAPVGSRKLNWVGYPRVRRLQDGSVMVVYETGSDVEMVRSYDNGKTWQEPEILFEKLQMKNENGVSTEVRMANPELCQLQNGDLVVACNYRPVKAEITPFAIAIKRSTDNGESWTESQIIYEAEPRFSDGCWEPAFLQLPDGELQVYFANEAPYTHSDEQEISMISSQDNGATWNKNIKTVSFRENRRDGMPAPLLVDDEILVGVEDNKIGQFKPYIVRTSVSENWNTPVHGNSSNREYALKDSLPDKIYAGAPYLLRVPSGEVVLSYQTTSGRTSNWEMSTLEVAIGDKKGRNFEKLTRPFDVPLDREAKWNSISLWDENTVVAAATTSFRSPDCEVWIILGHLIPELKIPPKSVKVDGDLSEWEEKLPVFLGSKSETNLSGALGYDEQNLYFCATVTDNKLFYNTQQPQNSDGVNFYIDAGNYNLTEPDQGMFKIECSYKEDLKVWEGNNGEWNEISSDNLALTTSDKKSGYQLEMAVPFSFLEKKDKSDIRFTVGLIDYQDGELKQVEHIVHSVPESSNTWLKAEF